MLNKFILPVSQWLLLIVLLGALIFATEKAVQHQQQLARGEQLKHEIASADPIRSLIETELNTPLYLSTSLSAYIKANKGEVSATEINLLLQGLINQAQHIRNIGVAPNNTLLYLYPLKNNAKALGLYYPDLESQWPDIRDIITQRQEKLVGPVSLVQGGNAFIYRIPVYLSGTDTYWGLISTVVNIDSIWQLVAARAAEQGVVIAVRPAINGDYADPAFYGDNSLFYDTSLLLDIELRGAKWQLAVRSITPPTDYSGIIRALCYSASGLILLLLFWLLLSKQHLRSSMQQVQRSKQYLQTVMDNVGDAIITADFNGVIEQGNLPCYSIFGYIKASLPGMHWSILLAEPSLAAEIIRTISDQKTEYETFGQRYDGSTFPLAIRLSSITLQQQPRQLIVLRDLSEWHKTEQLKQQFISTVSHELRTPLTSITGALGLIVGGALGNLAPAQARVLHLAHNNSQHLSQLISDLLDMEQLTNQSMVFNIKPVTLSNVLKQCAEGVTANWQQKNQTINIETPDKLKAVQVLADKQRLADVILHLLTNACKFSPPESSIIIKVTAELTRVRITVADKGKGVNEDFVPKLFDRFTQADSSDTRDDAGTGLGLAISKAMISHMHGSIGYLPNKDQGSCFYIELHLHEPQSHQADET
ncbi:sensor histidine kinase [Rheinheimera salexigens]|uniref:histidine kinase n=1 Tax=Rheinheimera salexigens TaxID=1628148 RepID=A0A1E7QAI3_9GAMM|nr:ATP-binding protein [Rheinheimera salexigens]OEY71150.1 hypothetical protein BI198_15775 [Rheinheimera salexigens]